MGLNNNFYNRIVNWTLRGFALLAALGIMFYILISSQFAVDMDLCLPNSGYAGLWECAQIVKSIAGPIAIWSGAIFPLLLLNYFLRKDIVKSWLRFSAVTLPILWFFTLLTPPSCSGGFLFGCDNRVEIATYLGVGYLVVSAMIISKKLLSLHLHNSKLRHIWLLPVVLVVIAFIYGLVT